MAKIKNKFDRMDGIVAVIAVLFFTVLYFSSEALFTGDTNGYEWQLITREPVYSLLVKLVREVSQIEFPDYRFLIKLIQNILAACSVIFFVRQVRRIFELRTMVILGVTLLLLAPHIATPIAAESGMILTNAILTEGITISLMYFFMACLLNMLFYERKGSAFGALLLALIMSMTRGQLMPLLIIWGIVAGVVVLKKRAWRKFIWIFFALFLCFMARSYLTKAYNYSEWGYFVPTASGSTTIVSNVLYYSDREAGENLPTEQLQEIFYEVYDKMEQNKANYKYAPDGMIERGHYHEKYHDTIKFDYFTPAVEKYLAAEGNIDTTDYSTMMIATDEIAVIFRNALLPSCFFEYIKGYLSVAAFGFIRTVSIVRPFFTIYAFIMYLSAIAATVYLFMKNRESKAMQFMILVLLCICANVFATALVIPCFERYMIYQLPLFYIALLLEAKEIYGISKRSI